MKSHAQCELNLHFSMLHTQCIGCSEAATVFLASPESALLMRLQPPRKPRIHHLGRQQPHGKIRDLMQLMQPFTW